MTQSLREWRQCNGYVQGAYVTDIRHYLDEYGEMASMPTPARSLASFLTLLIDEATSAFPAEIHDTGIRCRTKECNGTIKPT